MTNAHIEVLVEPFRENEPGPHVHAVVEAIESTGLEAEMGPFATIADGDLDLIVDAVAALVRASLDAGATAIQLRVERS